MAGSLELESMRGNAADLVTARTMQRLHTLNSRATHVSVLFSGAAMRSSQEWRARVMICSYGDISFSQGRSSVRLPASWELY